MLVLSLLSDVKKHISLQKQQNKKIGFVPTMGALHDGHISLISISKLECDYTVCSIFVNPTQFNNSTDLSKYPRTPELDIALLKLAGCDLLYMPDVKDIYPETDERKFDFGYLDAILEGEHRPGHYNGVGQVVSKLFLGITPDKGYFGSKDYQQVMVVKSLVKQLQLPVEIVSCPILREKDGLAMSSRNALLTPTERVIAVVVPTLMQHAITIIKTQGIHHAKIFVNEAIAKIPTMKLDYYEVCDAETLMPLKELNTNAVSLIAVFVGNIRLIDNWMVD